MSDLASPWNGFVSKINTAATPQELESIRLEIFGRKSGALTAAMRELGNVTPEQRKELGQQFNMIKQVLETVLAERLAGLESASLQDLANTDALDLTLSLPPQSEGHQHLIHEFIRKVEEVFGRMGFDVAEGPEIETEENNFNKLNIPPDHPARDMQDTFWIDSADRKVLRTQTSGVQVRYMQTHKPPFRIIYHGKTYRKDSDATHSPMFHQFEALMVGENISLANMKAVMITAIRELTSSNADFRFRTGFFPFVEPGLEVDMRWQGDESKSREGKWLEIAGCGMVHPNILTNVGIDPKKYQGFAFGFGIERMIMIKHQIPDLRLFYSGDLRFLKQF